MVLYYKSFLFNINASVCKSSLEFLTLPVVQLISIPHFDLFYKYSRVASSS